MLHSKERKTDKVPHVFDISPLSSISRRRLLIASESAKGAQAAALKRSALDAPAIDGTRYWADAAWRWCATLDLLRQRANNMLDHEAAGMRHRFAAGSMNPVNPRRVGDVG